MTPRIAKAKDEVEKLLEEAGLKDNVFLRAAMTYDDREKEVLGLLGQGTDIMDCSETVYVVDRYFSAKMMAGYFIQRGSYLLASPDKQKEIIDRGSHPALYKG